MPSVVSQTAEYALRAVATLAREPEQPLTAPRIADATRVPVGYLRKVLRSLTRAGLLRGQRGLHGGFTLARPPSAISVLDVVNGVDPIQRIASCPLALDAHGAGLCALHRRLDDAIALVEKAFAQTTIAEILAESGSGRTLCEAEANDPT